MGYVSEYKRKRQRKGTTTTRSKRRRKERGERIEKEEKEEREGKDQDGRRGVRVWRQQEVLDSSTQVDHQSAEERERRLRRKGGLDPSAALAEEIRRGPRGRRSQQLEAGMASPVSQNSSPNTGRRKEAATKLGLGRSWGSLDALAPPSTPEHRRDRYPVECNQCMLVQTGEKAHYLGLPCDACGQLPRSPYGMT